MRFVDVVFCHIIYYQVCALILITSVHTLLDLAVEATISYVLDLQIFTNFLSSAMIHATRPFVVNEWIQTKIEGYEVSGTVEVCI